MYKIILILFLVIASCKKKDCKMLHTKTENAWDDYEEASNNNKLNPTEENKKIAEEKYSLYEDADNKFLNRGCYKSKIY